MSVMVPIPSLEGQRKPLMKEWSKGVGRKDEKIKEFCKGETANGKGQR